MKNVTNAALILAIAFIGLIAWTGNAESPDDYSAPFNPMYTETSSDTITNAENDTITLSSRLFSKWTYNWTLNVTNLSGTTNVIVKVEESNSYSGNDWYPVGTPDTASGTELLRVYGDVVYGRRQRIIIDGTGTHSSTYTATGTYKREY